MIKRYIIVINPTQDQENEEHYYIAADTIQGDYYLTFDINNAFLFYSKTDINSNFSVIMKVIRDRFKSFECYIAEVEGTIKLHKIKLLDKEICYEQERSIGSRCTEIL